MCIVKSPGIFEGGDTIYFNSFKQGLFKLVYDGTSATNELALEDGSVRYYNLDPGDGYYWNVPNYHFETSTPVEPAATYQKVYVKAGQGLCSMDSGGTERCMAFVSGTSALGTGAISAGTCATLVTTAATGAATTDAIAWAYNAATPTTAGRLIVNAYPTANNVNFLVCNTSAGSITPGAATLNWRVVR
jgi:hypothetical protein